MAEVALEIEAGFVLDETVVYPARLEVEAIERATLL